jgi:hypothetical protein
MGEMDTALPVLTTILTTSGLLTYVLHLTPIL